MRFFEPAWRYDFIGGFGALDPVNFTPFPKNSVIGAFFREIHRADELGLKSKTGALKRSLQQLIDDGLAEYTIPEKPTSRLQKYRLTKKGRQVLSGIKKDDE